MRKVALVADTHFDTEQMPAVYFDYAVEQWNNHHRECQCLNCSGTEVIDSVPSQIAPVQNATFLFSLLVNSAMSIRNIAHMSFSLNVSLGNGKDQNR